MENSDKVEDLSNGTNPSARQRKMKSSDTAAEQQPGTKGQWTEL